MVDDRVLILGIGNDLLGDDAVGLRAADALGDANVAVQATARSGLALLDAVVGFKKVLLIDSQSTGLPPGAVCEFTLAPALVRSPSAHYVGYGEALSIAAAVGLELPDEIRVLAVERSPEVCFGDDLSEPVRDVLPAVVDRARAIARTWLQEGRPSATLTITPGS
ncbi:MAG: hydrogenase maturation protease [Armatimonadota bacterium]|nr:hydrogenase maturation protease [Armatimonadota bacterium]MDR7518714.1 hydrogenase maturation protease [Armatimonadota bacterium]MDR7550030.1 hydrogenase maturation protease [Armatimonadota bacterium]